MGLFNSIFGEKKQEPITDAEWMLKCNKSLEKGNIRGGMNCIDKALDLNPKNFNALLLKSSLLGGAFNNFKEAEVFADKALQINSNSEDALFAKALAISHLGRFDEVIIYLDRLIKINPNYLAINPAIKDPEMLKNASSAWSEKGFALAKLEKYEDSVSCYNKALELRPNAVYSLSNKGVSLYKLGRYDEALTCLREATIIPHIPALINEVELAKKNQNKK
jgi:tetratricopeptide (TPR) repeat protein